MEMGMIGRGRMGANRVRRILDAGHRCVVYDRAAEALRAVRERALGGTSSLDEMLGELKPPRARVDGAGRAASRRQDDFAGRVRFAVCLGLGGLREKR